MAQEIEDLQVQEVETYIDEQKDTVIHLSQLITDTLNVVKLIEEFFSQEDAQGYLFLKENKQTIIEVVLSNFTNKTYFDTANHQDISGIVNLIISNLNESYNWEPSRLEKALEAMKMGSLVLKYGEAAMNEKYKKSIKHIKHITPIIWGLSTGMKFGVGAVGISNFDSEELLFSLALTYSFLNLAALRFETQKLKNDELITHYGVAGINLVLNPFWSSVLARLIDHIFIIPSVITAIKLDSDELIGGATGAIIASIIMILFSLGLDYSNFWNEGVNIEKFKEYLKQLRRSNPEISPDLNIES